MKTIIKYSMTVTGLILSIIGAGFSSLAATIKDNREVVMLGVIMFAILLGASSIGYSFRGGNPSIYWGK